MRFLIKKKHYRKTDKKPTKKPTKTDKNRQKPINFFGPSARPTKTDSEKGLSVYNPGQARMIGSCSNENSKECRARICFRECRKAHPVCDHFRH